MRNGKPIKNIFRYYNSNLLIINGLRNFTFSVLLKTSFFLKKKHFLVKTYRKIFIFGSCYHIGKQDFHGKYPVDGIMGEHR